jgi:hypothetical protein
MKRIATRWSLLLLLLLLVMKSSPSTSALGQTVGHCLYECETSLCADFGNNTNLCVDRRAECQTKCSNIKYWGAIAYSSKDKGAGWSFGWNDLDQAKKEAMSRCSKRGAACQLWVWFDNSCGAIAVDGNTITWGTAYAKADADARALLECRKAGGRNCVVQASVCSRK